MTYLPNSNKKIWTFTQQQLDWLQWNYGRDQKQQDESDEVKAMQGFLLAVRDPKTWLMCSTLYATYTAAAVNNFFPTVVGGLGFGRNLTYVLTAPPFILCVIAMLCNGFHSDKVSANSIRPLATPAGLGLTMNRDGRTLFAHRPAFGHYSNCKHHRSEHTQHWCSLLCHVLATVELLQLCHLPAVLDFGLALTTSSQTGSFDCNHQCHLQHSEHLDELSVLRFSSICGCFFGKLGCCSGGVSECYCYLLLSEETESADGSGQVIGQMWTYASTAGEWV